MQEQIEREIYLEAFQMEKNRFQELVEKKQVRNNDLQQIIIDSMQDKDYY